MHTAAGLATPAESCAYVVNPYPRMGPLGRGPITNARCDVPVGSIRIGGQTCRNLVGALSVELDESLPDAGGVGVAERGEQAQCPSPRRSGRVVVTGVT